VKPERVMALYEWCKFLKGARETLRTIARMDRGDFAEKPIPFPESSYARFLGWRTDERGMITMTKGDVSKAIEGVEAARIRICPICARIFWAGRIDQPSCRKGCANALRVRRYRDGYRDRYKYQRFNKSERLAVSQAERERQALASVRAPSTRRRAVRLPKATSNKSRC